MYSYTKKSNRYLTHFVNAFEEIKEQKRNLIGISDIDNFLSFLDKKNICIVNKSTQNTFLYHLVTNMCLHHNNIDTNGKKVKTVLIDAGSGNNLHYIYLNMIGRHSSRLLSASYDDVLNNISYILDNILVTRAFTFYQLANIIIKEIPKLLDKLDDQLQIIVLDFLYALSSSSSSSSSCFSHLNKNDDENESNYYHNFQYDLKLLEEMVDKLVQISKKHFVLLSYNDNNKLLDNCTTSLFSKFQNVLEIDNAYNKNIKKINRENPIQLKINSKNIINNNKTISIIENSFSNYGGVTKITEYVK